MLPTTRITITHWSRRPLTIAILYGAAWTLFITATSLLDFPNTPNILPSEGIETYKVNVIYTLIKLFLWSVLIATLLAYTGILSYLGFCILRNKPGRTIHKHVVAIVAIGVIGNYQFLWHLLTIPSSVMASFNYNQDLIYPIFKILEPKTLSIYGRLITVTVLVPIVLALVKLMRRQEWHRTLSILIPSVLITTIVTWSVWTSEPAPTKQISEAKQPNVLLIGSSHLRADRLGINGYERDLTPNIDSLANIGINFTNTTTPKTGNTPNILTILTGTASITLGDKSNQNLVSNIEFTTPSLPKLFADAGYQTSAIGDWAASDLGKFSMGFQHKDIAPRKWRNNYVLRQWPKDLRIFLSLFTHNRFGKTFLPELYYLRGNPLTTETLRETRWEIHELAQTKQPFFITVFTASTHIPFGSTYPYYRLFSEHHQSDVSRFVLFDSDHIESMLKLPNHNLTLSRAAQINNLYDGAIKLFDDEVGKTIDYLKQSNLLKNTIVVIFSEQGIDLPDSRDNNRELTISENANRVPLVIYNPALGQPATVKQKTSTIDIAPTLLESSEIPIPSSMQGRQLFKEHKPAN